MNKGINLLKTEKKISVSFASQKLNLLRIIAVGLLFSISAFSIILFLFIILSPLPELQKQEKTLLTTLSNSHADMAKLFLVNDRLKSTKAIIEKRSNFDQSLGLVKQRMSNDIAITALTMDKDVVSVTVLSSSLPALDAFLTNLITAVDEKKDFSKVSMVNFLADEVRNKYSLTVEVIAL